MCADIISMEVEIMTILEKIDEIVYFSLRVIWKVTKKIIHILLYVAIFIGTFWGLNMLWPPGTFSSNKWGWYTQINLSREVIPEWIEDLAAKNTIHVLGYTWQGIDFLMLFFSILVVVMCFVSFELPHKYYKKVINSSKYYSVSGGRTLPWIVLGIEIIGCLLIYHWFWNEPFSWVVIIEFITFLLFFGVFNQSIISKVAPHNLIRALLYNIIVLLCLGIILNYFLYKLIIVAGVILILVIIFKVISWWYGF